MIAWSYGGGVQSVCIGVLIAEGTLPVPDLAGIADTGRERRTTWDYLHNVMQPYLDRKGVPLKIEVVPHALAGTDLYAKDGLTYLPAYTGEGRLAAFCSGKWKQDVMERWLRLKGVKECDQWIGFSTDEMRRANKKNHRPWCRLRYPLIERFISRDLCKALITAAGLPLPKKSRCWMCPHQDDAEWAEVRADPEEWAAAVALEREINGRDPEQKGLYLYAGRVPLPLAEFGRGKAILPPARPCEGESCWT